MPDKLTDRVAELEETVKSQDEELDDIYQKLGYFRKKKHNAKK